MHKSGDKYVAVYRGKKELFDNEEDARCYEATGEWNIHVEVAKPKTNVKKVRSVRKKKRK